MSRNTNFDGLVHRPSGNNGNASSGSERNERTHVSVGSRNIARNRRMLQTTRGSENSESDSNETTGLFQPSMFTQQQQPTANGQHLQPTFSVTQGGSLPPQDYLQTFINSSMVSEVQSNRVVLFSRDNGGMLKNSTVRIDPTGNVKGVRDLEATGTVTITGSCVVQRGASLKVIDDPVDDNDVATKAYVDAAFDRQRDLAFSNNFKDMTSGSTATTAVNSGMNTPRFASPSFSTVDPLLSDFMKTFTVPSTPVDSGSGSLDPITTEFYESMSINDNSIGLNPKQAVSLATTKPLPDSEMKLAGAGGIGDAIVSTVPGRFPPVDSVVPIVGDRILVKNEVRAERNGVYCVQDVGSDTTCWSIVRSADYDQPREIPLGYFFVKNGEHNKNTTWVNMNKSRVTLGITPVTFVQFSNVGELKVGRGLLRDGGEIRVHTEVNSLSINKDGKLQVSSQYPGQTSITTVGTIGVGTWAATPIDPKYGGTGHAGLPKNRILISNGDSPLGFKALPLGEIVGTLEPQILQQKLFVDETTAVQDTIGSRRVQFSVAEVTPGTNRVLNLPDCNTTLVGTNNIAVLTNKIIDQSNEVCASYFRNSGSAIKLQDTVKPSEGQILTLVGTTDSDTGVAACWKTPESSLNFENVGAAGVGLFKQKVNGTVLLKKLHTPSEKIKITDAYNNERADFDVVEQKLKLNEIGGTEILGVAKGGTGLSTFPSRKVCVGAINSLEMKLQAPMTDFVGLTDTQTLENKTVSGLKNKVTATGLVSRSCEYMMMDGVRNPLPGDVLSIDDNKLNMVWKPLPQPMTIGNAGTGAPIYYKTMGNTHMMKTITGGSGISVDQGTDGTLTVGFKASLLNVNDFLGTLSVEHGGTGLKSLVRGKVLTVDGAGTGIVCERDHPISGFVGVTDKQELKNKILTDTSNVIAAGILTFPIGKVVLVGGTAPTAGDVLTSTVGKNGELAAEWKPIPKSVGAVNVGDGCEIFKEKRITDSEAILTFRTVMAKRPDIIDVKIEGDAVGIDLIEQNVNINQLGGGALEVARGGTGVESFAAGCVLVGNGLNGIAASKVAPRGSFVGTIDQQTLENKVIKDPSNVVSASLLRACGGDLLLDTDTKPEVGYILKVIEPGVVGWRPMSDDNPEVQKYQALFKPTVAEVMALKKENESLKLAFVKLNMHISNILEKISSLESRASV